jgi:hypothetical protein
MKKQQDNFPSLSALLRAADSVDTLGTNSLCCAAAGIIAPSSATAEALVPHEKLRGAALADATLNAQERPLAQPALGYKTRSKPNSDRRHDSSFCRYIQVLLLYGFIENLDRLRTRPQRFDLSIIRPRWSPLFHHDNRFRQFLLNFKDIGNNLVRKRFGESNSKSPTTLLQTSMTSLDKPHAIPLLVSLPKESACRFIGSTLSQMSCTALSFLRRPFRCLNLPIVGVVGNHESGKNCQDRTNCLYPSRRTFRGPVSEYQCHHYTDKKRAKRGHNNLQQRIGLKADYLRKHGVHLLAFKGRSLIASGRTVHGGAK